MHKLAFFVEGFTEVLFVKKLIEEIAGANNVQIESRRIRGGSKARRSFALVQAAKPSTGQNYYVLIIDCGGDRLVKNRILEEHENLTKSGYQRIVGMRDVRPDFTHATLRDLETMLHKYIKTKLIPVEFILAILEIEAWFLSESTHFPRIDAAITLEAIKSRFGFDPENDDMQQRAAPADDLHMCYSIGGKSYQKDKASETINALEFSHIYVSLVQKLSPLKRLVGVIEEFLGS